MSNALRIAGWLARIVVGAVLVYSGVVKLAHPHELLNSVFQYRLLDPGSATVFAAALPIVELTVGVALLCGIWTLGASFLASLLFVTFSAAQASVLLRGISADCGCFGIREAVSVWSMVRTLALALGALFLLLRAMRARAPSVSGMIPALT